MAAPFAPALSAGAERLAAWADLLDEINVFPVADGDTGRNLVVSLAPLRRGDLSQEALVRELLLSARGNAGNIAARFLAGLTAADSIAALPGAIRRGRDGAWRAVADPKPGTMLSLFDALAEVLSEAPPVVWDARWCGSLLDRLETAVRATRSQLPRLQEAGVIDAGALGAFLFLEGFLISLAGDGLPFRRITEVFSGGLALSPAFRGGREEGCCIDAVLKVSKADRGARERIAAAGESVVVLEDGDLMKVHLHVRDGERARVELTALGEVIRWSTDDLGLQGDRFQSRNAGVGLHIMTDAAGSLTRDAASALGMTLLESYITLGGSCLPETRLAPEELYGGMRRGLSVSTAQASDFERGQCYESVLERHGRVLYLCVGSVFTGNYAAAAAWKKEADSEDRLILLDTGAASGRLGLLAIAVARFAQRGWEADAVVRYAQGAVARCEEYLFLDRLKYLAAGGRLSRTGALVGDGLGMKPVISPLAEGARRVGLVRDRAGQLRFALERVEASLGGGAAGLVLLEYTDNADWVAGTVRQEVARRCQGAEILLTPLSLTAGAHMGPGTWGVAVLPGKQGK